MKKVVLILISTVFLLAACHNEKAKEEKQNTETVTVDEIIPVTVSEFETKAGDLTGKKITITGTVDHVCQHGGQKMFLIETGSENRVKITPDENISAFKSEWEGQNIQITGIVEEQRIDEDFLKEWEEEVMSGDDMGDDKGEGKHLGGNMEKGGEDAEKDVELEKINNLRQQIEASEKGYLSFFTVLCTDYHLEEPADTTEEGGE